MEPGRVWRPSHANLHVVKTHIDCYKRIHIIPEDKAALEFQGRAAFLALTCQSFVLENQVQLQIPHPERQERGSG